MRSIAFSFMALAFAISLHTSQVAAVEVGVEIDIGTFETELAPHGKWVEVDGNRAWQPSIVVTDANWQPYLNEGHWVSTDEGWYWESTYEWGWAPFHYGRWDRVANYNWVWTPDTVWAPSWVSWRESDNVYGWAPLGRSARFEGGVFVGGNVDVGVDFYHFVPAESFLSINLGSVAFNRERSREYYGNTRVVNNSYTVTNNRVVNNGIPVTRVAAATHQQIKPVAISDAKSPTARGASANGVSAYRPAVKGNNAARQPKNVSAENRANTEAKTNPANPRTEDPKTRANEARTNEAKPHAVEPRTEQPAAKTPVAPHTEAPNVRTPETRHEAKPEVNHNAEPKTLRSEEPKARTPEPRAERNPEPRAVQPHAEEPKARTPEPRAEPRAAEPRAAQPRAEEPKGRNEK